MKSVLITGGSGAFGQYFAQYLLSVANDPPSRIVIYSRGEFRQFCVSQELGPLDKHNRLRFFIGDVRDRDRLRRAMQGIEIVVHAAALKRIEVGNYNPIEMVKTNVDGAVNVIEAAQDADVKKVVALSSDKAYQPVSPYGTSKALAESIFLAANNTTGEGGPKFSICRYGNIWGSTGSVVPVWSRILATGNKNVPVTDPDCTRFFMRMQGAANLVMDTISTMRGGEIAIPALPAYRLGDLAVAMGATISIIGLPAWEKKHECMSFDKCSNTARRMTIGELQEELKNEMPSRWL